MKSQKVYTLTGESRMIDYKTKVQEVLERIYSKEYKSNFSEDLMALVRTDPVIDGLFVNALNPEGHGGYFQFLKEIVMATKPMHVVELGNREGMSTVSIIDGMRTNASGYFTSVDIINDLRFVPEEAKRYPYVNFVFGDCLDPKTVSQISANGPIDILFLDTIHTKAQLKAEWSTYEPLLADEALILIDDVDLNDKGQAFADIKHEKFNDIKLHVSGFGVVFYKRDLRTDEEFWDQQ